ncbi:hypothetical protein [Desulfitobacterium chlororespirans]|uniref:Uncharacterized protein n=1 Tax=Desulfitobacterium chlororespirans DSM 11544 TaxID=1121395 RepID=A0A1M7UYD7_9FIRM|nr:hypothetical protein [Desulfitobacterium chlororespirans]SHN87979.1 hypothetical protein SAMN02745215_05063 [Desulfitobacterium chlororespirans DSM 11544]
MENRTKHLIINVITISIGLVISYTVLYNDGGGEVLGLDGNTIALVVALISVAGSLIAHFFLFKKDSSTIKDVKVDTAEIRPIVKDTNEIIKKVSDNVLPMSRIVEESRIGIQNLVDELNFQRGQKSEQSKQVLDKDFFLNGIAVVYEQNARLENQNRDLRATNQLLVMKNNSLEKDNAQLRSYVRELEDELGHEPEE